MIVPITEVCATPIRPIVRLWAASEVVGLEIWLIVVSLGLLILTAEVIRLIVRAQRRVADEARGNERVVRVVNPSGGVVPLSISPMEVNLRDGRYARYLGPFASDQSTEGRQPMPWTKVASPPLRGRIVLVSIFVGADGRWWSDTEIARQLSALERAARWMEKEAGRYGVPVEVGLADAYFSVEGEPTPEVAIGFQPEGMDFGPYEQGIATRALVLMSRAAATLGFQDAVDFVQEIRARLPGTIPVWLLHVRQAGRSLAVPLDLTELDGVSLALCYARSASFTESIVRPPVPDAATMTHEILHLFGASDKYGMPLDHYSAGAVTHRDIMRLDYDRLEQLRVDPLTARELGWTDEAAMSKRGTL